MNIENVEETDLYSAACVLCLDRNNVKFTTVSHTLRIDIFVAEIWIITHIMRLEVNVLGIICRAR